MLLEPAGRGVRPTAAGQLLARHAASLLDHLAEAEAALAALTAGETGVLRLASFATAGAELIPPALATVQAALPELEISLRMAERDEALSRLRSGTLDVAVIAKLTRSLCPAEAASRSCPCSATRSGSLFPAVTDSPPVASSP